MDPGGSRVGLSFVAGENSSWPQIYSTIFPPWPPAVGVGLASGGAFPSTGLRESTSGQPPSGDQQSQGWHHLQHRAGCSVGASWIPVVPGLDQRAPGLLIGPPAWPPGAPLTSSFPAASPPKCCALREYSPITWRWSVRGWRPPVDCEDPSCQQAGIALVWALAAGAAPQAAQPFGFPGQPPGLLGSKGMAATSSSRVELAEASASCCARAGRSSAGFLPETPARCLSPLPWP